MVADVNVLLAQLDGIEGLDTNFKTELVTAVKTVVKERGEFGSKLQAKDGEINALKTASLGYAKAQELLAKSGVSAEDIPGMLEKLGVQKTLEEENTFLKGLAKSRENEASEAKKQVARFKAEKAIGSILEKELKEFKDESGKAATIHADFIDTDKLLDGIVDVTDTTVLSEKVKLALKEGYVKQEQLKVKFGFPGAKLPGSQGEHKTPSGDHNLDIATILKEQGPYAAIAAARAMQNKG